MLGAMVGVDPNDAATTRCVPPPGNDYTRYLRRAGLQGARIGIPRANFYRTDHQARHRRHHWRI